MPRDKIDPNDAEELGRNGHCRCIYDIYVRVNRTTTTPTSRTFPPFIVRSNDSFTAIIFTISFALLRLRSERKYSFYPANDLIYLKKRCIATDKILIEISIIILRLSYLFSIFPSFSLFTQIYVRIKLLYIMIYHARLDNKKIKLIVIHSTF